MVGFRTSNISEWLFEKRVNKFYTIFERENNNVYDWFVNSMYLDLGNPNFERFINNRT